MLNNLVIATFILAVGQPSGGPPLKPITDPDAYSIYATLLPSVWKLSGELILLVQETERESCRVSRLPEGWEGVQEDFDRQNAVVWALRPVLPLGDYRLIPRAEIQADDARLAQEYPGGWQRRPGSMEFAAVSAVGFNAAKTKALVYIRLRGSGQIYLMERRDVSGRPREKGCDVGGLREVTRASLPLCGNDCAGVLSVPCALCVCTSCKIAD